MTFEEIEQPTMGNKLYKLLYENGKLTHAVDICERLEKDEELKMKVIEVLEGE